MHTRVGTHSEWLTWFFRFVDMMLVATEGWSVRWERSVDDGKDGRSGPRLMASDEAVCRPALPGT